MTEISVSAFRVYCHPCHALFISPCAYTATNWRQVRFKPMLLMGKNVWYVLALVPFLYLAQRPPCSCSSRSVCLCSHQTPLFSLHILPQFERQKSLDGLRSKGQKYIRGHIANNSSSLWCRAAFSLCSVIRKKKTKKKLPGSFCSPCKNWLKFQASQLSGIQLWVIQLH